MYINFPKVEGVVVQEMDTFALPRMIKIRQLYDDSKITDISGHIVGQMHKAPINPSDMKGKRICITAGSRGIPHFDIIMRSVCDQLKAWGAEPFIIPAMGSHGGGTAQGQREILEGYNITEESMGVPVISCMDVVQYGSLSDGTPLYCDKNAYESDGVVLLHKVKPHTDFRGVHESGLAKMIAIGIAKHKGASVFHKLGFAQFAKRIPEAAEIFLKNVPVAFGVAIIQNAYDEISTIEVVPAGEIMEADKRLLVVAKERIPKFKFKELDVLVIDEIGKNISGYGQDPNVTGRANGYEPGFSNILKLKKLFIRGLSEQTHHNACGIGEADITTQRCVNSIDWASTWTNLITSTEIQGCCIPMYANSDREALQLAIRTCAGTDLNRIKMARIKNTLDLFEIEVSEALWDEIKESCEVQFVEGPYAMKFDEDGYMV